ncbi:MAG TPA: efflux RND transporter periplasmic adaptor subunit [Candidatus Eisenbacteria bacterium]|nr:efflux RND transporter periplasmic adaptor subunit [Candidatus Eisenbacteria bacterium]
MTMTPSGPTTPDTSREAVLRGELQLAYEQLTEITSRLLLANEAAEAAMSGEDRGEIAERFLRSAARGIEARRAAMFLVEGGGIGVGATFGLSEEEAESLASSDADLDACQAALDAHRIHVTDDDLVSADAHAALAAQQASGDGAPAAGGNGDEAEEDEDGDEEEEEDEDGDEAEEEEEDEEDEEEEEEEAEEEDAGAEDGDEGEAEADEDETEENGSVTFGVYLPVHLEDQPIGVMALGERGGGRTYRNEDLVFLEYLLRQFGLILHRSTLLEQNRERLEERDALLKVSREISSTLDLDAVLRSVVNTVAAVVPNDRAEIALVKADRLVLRAISGMTRLDPDQAELFKLPAVLEYLRTHPHRLHIGAGDLDESAKKPGHDVFSEYFSAQQMRSFMALPLKDDHGLLGYLCIESAQESWDLEPAEGDALSILASQTTTAIRNATLYSEIPLRGVSLPVSQLRSRLSNLTRRGRVTAVVVAALALVGLVLPITPERAGGGAEVRPLRYQGVRALTEGVVTRALVKGGDEVQRGQVLAEVEDLDLAGRLAELRSQIESARRDMAAARLSGDVAAWRSNELRLNGLEGTMAVEEKWARGRVLTAPFSGQILELDLSQRVGQHLDAGDPFCTVAALHIMAVDFVVPEEKIGQVRVGQPVAIKVMSFPTHTFEGQVSEVGWRGISDARGHTFFTVRAVVANQDQRLRPGMTGVAKATIGRRAAGALLLAPVLRSLQMRLW